MIKLFSERPEAAIFPGNPLSEVDEEERILTLLYDMGDLENEEIDEFEDDPESELFYDDKIRIRKRGGRPRSKGGF